MAGNWQHPTPEFCAELPRDPQRLYARLDTDSPNRPGYLGVVTYAVDALRSGLVPADVRAALYRALLLVPGMSIDEPASNLDGRRGVALAVDDGRYRREIIIDAGRGQFIGERDTLTRDEPLRGLVTGTVTTSTAVTTATVPTIGTPPATG